MTEKNEQAQGSELSDGLGVSRPTSEPGGCECENCGCIFIGAPTDTICGKCFETYERSMAKEYEASAQKEMLRAEYFEELRRDAFGA